MNRPCIHSFKSNSQTSQFLFVQHFFFNFNLRMIFLQEVTETNSFFLLDLIIYGFMDQDFKKAVQINQQNLES